MAFLAYHSNLTVLGMSGAYSIKTCGDNLRTNEVLLCLWCRVIL